MILFARFTIFQQLTTENKIKKLNLTLVILLTIFSYSTLFAETIFYDDFTVTSKGMLMLN